MDKLIAKKVMGWKCNRSGYYATVETDDLVFASEWDAGKQLNTGRATGWRWQEDGDYYACGLECEVWSPSTDMRAAWVVADKLNMSIIRLDNTWLTGCFNNGWWPDSHALDGQLYPSVEAETAPLAICRAALLITV